MSIRGGGGRIIDKDNIVDTALFPSFDYIFSPAELNCTDWRAFVYRKEQRGERRAQLPNNVL